MNIFVLDNDPIECAKLHVDKHVVKMILEHAQMICTAHHINPALYIDYNIPYKKTHVNHPCAKWVRDSMQNYYWLYKMTEALNDEYKFRFNHTVNHKSFDVIKSLPVPNLPNINMTKFARAMPDECKITDNIVKSYRNYYNMEKQNIMKWTNRNIPKWVQIE